MRVKVYFVINGYEDNFEVEQETGDEPSEDDEAAIQKSIEKEINKRGLDRDRHEIYSIEQ